MKEPDLDAEADPDPEIKISQDRKVLSLHSAERSNLLGQFSVTDIVQTTETKSERMTQTLGPRNQRKQFFHVDRRKREGKLRRTNEGERRRRTSATLVPKLCSRGALFGIV